ncbi:MAG: hypothetical protein IH914_08375, partial [candidate division Zixibacteria bacterium]|nr:hypothetical protein [candidate division Zixibacteria bacterium]
MARGDFCEELPERTLADDFLLPLDSKADDRIDFFLEDFLLRIVLSEPLDLFDEPPDLYTFFDEPDDVLTLMLLEIFLRDVLNGFKRLLPESELFEFLK